MGQSRRSHWAWGWEDRFPAPEARRALGAMVGAHTGIAASEPRDPVPLDSISLPASTVSAVPASLAEVVTTEDEARVRHTYGRAYLDLVRGFSGDFAVAPDAVAYPETESHLDELLLWADANRYAVVPYGGGTSVVRGVEPERSSHHNGVLTVDLSRMDAVLEVDDVSRLARIQAGVFGPALEQQLGGHGLTLRHYPQSFEFSTLGGWIATRAGGHFATQYTHIDDLVAAARMITPRGAWQSRCLPGSGAGPSPDRVVLGSEGTLGIITEAWMRVRPRPVYRATANVAFEHFSQAVDAVRSIAQADLYPANARVLDAREAALNGVRGDGRHVLLLGFESADHPLDAWIARAVTIAETCGGSCEKGPRLRDDSNLGEGRADGDASRWRQAFFDGPYLQSNLVSMGVLADTFETACTWRDFPGLHAALREGMREATRRICGADGVLTCRFTHVYPDGPAPYYTFLAPTRFGAEGEHWRELKKTAADILMSHGATITHHHAVGRTHRPWYTTQAPSVFSSGLRALKADVDPTGMLNPGILLPPASE